MTLITGLIVISRLNFLLFHSLIEMAITTVGFITFAFTWHLRRFNLGYLLVFGILLGCTASLSIFHLLSYKGMGVFEENPNIPTQLWIASRYQFSIILLIASLFPKKSFNPNYLLTTIGLISVGLVVIVFNGYFPDCYIVGIGQTSFKIISEYIISTILMISMGLFWKNRKTYPNHVSLLILLFFGFSILAELVFTSYLGVYDLSNVLGHIFHLTASYLLYKAIVETGLENPFDLLFKNLNEAVRVRDEFISMASHELKTPLTPLKMQLQMFQRVLLKNPAGAIPEDQVLKILSSSNEQVDKLNKLIDGMLDVSRLNTGSFEISREEVDVGALITDLTKRHETQIASSGSTLKLNVSPTKIKVDPMRLEQVISNILMNAIKYAPESLIEIGVRSRNNRKTEIWISDTGPGISKEYQDRIFERYERATSRLSIGGLGLGLFISRQIIEAHGGTLSVVSNVNQGSIFIISLPFHSE